MQLLLGVVFALLLAGEIALLVMVGGVVSMFPFLLWQRSPWQAGITVISLGAVTVSLWRAHRAESARSTRPLRAPPEISISHIPITGTAGSIYMLQFLVWVLSEPVVGMLYAALIAGGLFILPLNVFLNRRGRPASSVGLGSLLGVLCGLAVVASVSVREFPLAAIFGVALGMGVLASPVLVWQRSRAKHVSIAARSAQDE